MNKKQWSAFGTGLLVLAVFFWVMTGLWISCTSMLGSSVHTACIIKQQYYAISAIFSTVLAIVFFFCAKQEKK